MGHLLNYALASSIYLAVGYLCYRFALSGARQHSFNRIVLHAIVILSLAMPLIHTSLTPFSHETIAPAQPIPGFEFELIPGGIVEAEKPIWPVILLYVYLAGCAAILTWTLFSLFKIHSLVIKGEKQEVEIHGIRAKLTVTHDDNTAPFSWIRNIVIGHTDFEENGEAILIHEAGHIRHAHSIDMLAYLPLLAFQWFNPAAWLIVQELRSVHEFQADSDVLKSGVDIRQYQIMLIKKAVGTRFPSPANSLNHSNLKNRITMMYKKRSSVGRKAAALLVVPAMALALSVTNIPAVASVLSMASSANLFADSGDKISNNIPELKMTESEIAEINTEITAEIPEIAEITEPSESAEISNVGNEVSEPYNSGMVEEKVSDTNKKYTEEELKAFIAEHKAKYMEASNENASNTQSSEADQAKKDVFVAVEKMAEFPGGMEELMKWLTNNIRYPEEAMKNDTQGRVIVKFIIEEDGKISNPTIVRGVSPELDKEALRVVSEMPTWTPGEVNGKPVASYFNLPIAFKLTKPSTEKTE